MTKSAVDKRKNDEICSRKNGARMTVLKSYTAMALLMLTTGAAYAQTPPAAPVGDYRANPGHTGASKESLTAPLTLLWRHTASAAKNNPASAVYGKGVVYFVSGGVAYALDAADGTTRWQYPADGKPQANFGATPTLDGAALYLADDTGQVTRLEAATGKAVWVAKLEGAIRSSPAVSGGTVYLGSGASHCYALSADTGKTIWDQQTAGAVTTAPIVIGGIVAFAAADGNVYGLGARDGRKAWSQSFDPDPSTQAMAYDGQFLYVTSGPVLARLDPSNGNRRPTVTLPTLLAAPPTVSTTGLYAITQSNVLYALAPTGGVRWKATLDSASSAPPLLAGGVILVPTQGGVVSGYDAGSGKLVWQYAVQGSATDSQPKAQTVQVSAAPMLADGTLYVVGDDGTLSAFRTNTPDNIGPQFPQLVPAEGQTVPSDGLTYGALLVDEGSGINPATLSMSVDGQPDTKAMYQAGPGSLSDTPTTPLKEGEHKISVTATDWRGNKATQTWSFRVRDNNGGFDRGGRGGRGGGGFNPFSPDYPGRGGRDPNAPPPPPPITPF